MADETKPKMPPNLSKVQQDMWETLTPAEQEVIASYLRILALMPTVEDRGTMAAMLAQAAAAKPPPA